MTKAELVKALEGMPDDTEIMVPSFDSNVWIQALYVERDWDGTDEYQAEVFISGDENE